MRNSTERGIAMVTTLLVLMLMSALLVGFTTIVMSDQRYRFIDRDRGQAFYAASGGIEKLTADLGNLFLEFVAPTAAQVTALTAAAKLPVIAGITYTSPTAPAGLPASLLTASHCARDAATGVLKTPTLVGTNGYTITFCKNNASGNPTFSDDPSTIAGTGPYAGLTGLQSPYQLDVTAKTTTGGEVHLIRTINAVAIPVFQFMMFSDSDQSFFAGADFTFGGRVHTNGNLWLAEGTGNTLTMTGRVTAVKDVVRQFLSNGSSIDVTGHLGIVSMATALAAPAGNRNLLRTEGSVVGMPLSAPYALWQTVSLGATPANYNGFLKNTATGAKKLNLPLTAPGVGGTNVDIVRRPLTGEDTTGILYNERLFTKASVRILLSDLPGDLTTANIPGLTATLPVLLEGDWKAALPFAGYVGPPIARSLGTTALTTTIALTNAGDPAISVAAAPPWFVKPQIMVRNPGGTIKAGPFTCTTWTETQFQGCNITGAVTLLNGWTIYRNDGGGFPSLAGNMPGDGAANAFLPTVTLNGNVLIGNPRTMSLNAGQTTWAFAANTFFINDTGAGGSGLSTPVTCSGFTSVGPPIQFTGCTGVPATRTGATITTSYATPQNTPTIGGYIKIEKADAAGVWTDVTQEILNYGIGAPNQVDPAPAVFACADPSPNGIVRLQRLRDNGSAGATPLASCPVVDTTNSYEWWPNALFDTREGLQRDANPGTLSQGLPLGGVMYYVALDAKNLAKWFRAAAPYAAGTGNTARTDNGGYSVYFSDRRNNRNALSRETGEFGFEDFVNPGVANGVPNGICNLPGEDVDEKDEPGFGTCETYGQFPSYNGVYNSVIAGSVAPLDINVRPFSALTLVKRGVAQVNRPVLFRRALKLINGSALNNLPTVAAERITGLTIVSENPVYVQGNWNAYDAASYAVAAPHAATAVIADAVTLLSNNWNDNNSFALPYAAAARVRPALNYYRLAILAGKGPSFALPADEVAMPDFGTDGGAHNFLRMLEGGGGTLNYRGSMATLFYNRQAVGTYKCCTGVYGAPTRAFVFDTDFTNPALLPPLTPMFRDMNAVGFSQELRPGK